MKDDYNVNVKILFFREVSTIFLAHSTDKNNLTQSKHLMSILFFNSNIICFHALLLPLQQLFTARNNKIIHTLRINYLEINAIHISTGIQE